MLRKSKQLTVHGSFDSGNFQDYLFHFSPFYSDKDVCDKFRTNKHNGKFNMYYYKLKTKFCIVVVFFISIPSVQ